MREILVGTSFEIEKVVTEEMKACIVGSGDVNVLATPMMIAFMENCASNCIKQFLDDGETSMGAMINSTHISPTPVGMKVFVKATVTEVDRKKIDFEIIARDEREEIGKATHTRFIVNKEKFENKSLEKQNA